MNVFLKLLTRSRLFTAGIILLLILAVALGCIGVSAYSSAQEQLSYVDGLYTSIAVARTRNAYFEGSFLGEFASLSPELRKALDTAPMHLTYDRRCMLAATVPGTVSLTTRTFDPWAFDETLERPYTQAVLAVRCHTVQIGEYETGYENLDAEAWQTYALSKLGDPSKFRCLIAPIYFFDVEEVVSAMERSHPFPALTSGWVANLFCPDGTPLMEEGKTYLLYVTLGDIISTEPGTGRQMVSDIINYEFPLTQDEWGTAYPEEGKYYSYLPDGAKLCCTEYTSDLHAWLESEAGNTWREEVIPAVERSHTSVELLLTDCVDSIYAFNTRDVSILEGRTFTREEYSAGTDVCLVSSDYARLNGLHPGDTLHMDLYDPLQPFSGGYLSRAPYAPERDLQIAKDYTIVGVYTTPGFSKLPYAINPDTVLVPKQSVPGASTFDKRHEYNGAMVSVILQNGLSTDLEAYLKTQGLDNQLQYFDQGYNKITGSLFATADSARRLLIVSSVFFLLASVLAIFLFSRKLDSTARKLRLLGMSVLRVYVQSFGAMASLLLASALAGLVLAWALFDRVCYLLELGTLHANILQMLQAGMGQFLVLLLLGSAAGGAIAAKPLLQKRES